ncbi:hypothetical protein [Thermomonospora amylolytica]|uniref:hypothetical protein n=1 Tax=Thermomonospora amylolytica TaxID=1411117 RepID=UPI0013009DF5|nr:hypothetical protein [Thermomonospora amylolytica]
MAVLVAGCAPDSPIDAERGDRLYADLRQLLDRGLDDVPPTRLSDLTDFAWDRLYVYRETAGGRAIREDTGHRILDDEEHLYSGNLLVFTRGAELATAVTLPEMFAVDDGDRFSNRVLLAATDNPGRIELVEPKG